LFSEDAYLKEYNSHNAFGDTYGEHREKLELNTDWLPVLKSDCVEHGVKFMSTPFDEPSLDLICDVGVDIIKVASFDLGNLPFLKKIAQKNIPVVISTGGGGYDVIQKSVDMLTKYNTEAWLTRNPLVRTYLIILVLLMSSIMSSKMKERR